MKSKLSIICWIAVIAILFESALAQEPVRILILPFNIHSEKDISFLKAGIEDMLSSRLAWEGKVIPISKDKAELPGTIYEPTALSLAVKLEADYVVFGSITIIGDNISTDARCVDVHKKNARVIFHVTGKSDGDVISHIDLFASRINSEIFNRDAGLVARPEVRTQDYSSPQPQEKDDLRRHPEHLWKNRDIEKKEKDEPKEEKEEAPLKSVQETHLDKPAVVEHKQEISDQPELSKDIRKSKTFKMHIRAIAVGDIDGDSSNEIVIADENDIFIYRYLNGDFIKAGEENLGENITILSADTIDINGNKKAEIFITAIHQKVGTMKSLALEWNGKKFERIADKEKWYYRMISVPAKGDILLGQQRGASRVFAGSIYELKWENGEYVPGQKQDIPKWINVFGFNYGDVLNNKTEKIIAFSENDYLRLLDRNGDEEWKSSEHFGGSASYIDFYDEAAASIGNYRETNRFYLPQRIHIADIDNDGKYEVIVAKNTDAARRILSKTRIYQAGFITVLSWNEVGFSEKHRTPEISGHITDYVLADIDADGKDEVVFSVVTKTTSIFGKAQSYIVIWEVQKTTKD